MGAPQIFENLIQAKRLHSLSAPAPRIQDEIGGHDADAGGAGAASDRLLTKRLHGP
jgi:hypothetical protein